MIILSYKNVALDLKRNWIRVDRIYCNNINILNAAYKNKIKRGKVYLMFQFISKKLCMLFIVFVFI